MLADLTRTVFLTLGEYIGPIRCRYNQQSPYLRLLTNPLLNFRQREVKYSLLYQRMERHDNRVHFPVRDQLTRHYTSCE